MHSSTQNLKMGFDKRIIILENSNAIDYKSLNIKK